MRILHFADVHLDRPFVGVSSEAARRRRGELAGAFRRCLALANEHDVDLVTIGGELWEEEHVAADTRNSVVYELEQLDRQVLIICGNHDPLIPGGTYSRVTWPDNVRLVRTSEPELHDLGDVAVWGVSWTGGDLSASFCAGIRGIDGESRHFVRRLAGMTGHRPGLPGSARGIYAG